jgi:cytochrome P450
LRSLTARLDKVLYRLIAERRRGASADSPDMLNAMLATTDKDTGEGMDDKQLRDEIVTLLFAGFDTTARTLTWAFHLLGQNPDSERRLQAELKETLNGRAPGYEDVPRLAYTSMFIHETMRIYPPNPVVGRQAKADDNIGGYHIPAGSIITLSQYLAQRNPQFWDQPEQFRPERFAPEAERGRHRFAHFPFGGGPRQCIGKGLAMMTTTTALAMIAQEYQFCAVPDHAIKYDLKVTFQSRNGIPATRHVRGLPGIAA